MVEFNPDGSLKLSSKTLEYRKESEDRMSKGKCILIHKEVTNFTAPKKCVLHLRLSDAMNDSRFVENIHKYFKDGAATPTKLIKISDKEFDIEIGSDFKRCTDCTNCVNRYREFLEGNLILEKGNCTYAGFMKNFSYEDYFDE